jgi:hypothetical protein
MPFARHRVWLALVGLVVIGGGGCGSPGPSTDQDGGPGDAALGGDDGSSHPDANLGDAGQGGSGDGGSLTADEARALIEAYKAAHPGNGGKDWDINAKTPAEIASDPDAQRLLGLCGDEQRPVIPLLAWEYGGADHQWINPQASALVYCVYVPVSPSSAHWQYDAVADHVTADVHVLFPDENPCKDQQGKDQVMACLGDPSNIEILVDTASLNDGADAGLALANASTDLYLIQADGTRVFLHAGL